MKGISYFKYFSFIIFLINWYLVSRLTWMESFIIFFILFILLLSYPCMEELSRNDRVIHCCQDSLVLMHYYYFISFSHDAAKILYAYPFLSISFYFTFWSPVEGLHFSISFLSRVLRSFIHLLLSCFPSSRSR